MKITLEFSQYEIQQMVHAHLRQKELIPKGMTASVTIRPAGKDGFIAHAEITESVSYQDR